MKPRSVILGVVALALVLALHGRFVARRDTTGSNSQGSAPATAAPRLSSGLASGKHDAPAAAGILAAVPDRSRFADALAALSGTADSENWTATLNNLADRTPVAELAGAVSELNGAAVDSPRAMLRELLLARWTRLAPEDAAAWAVGLTDPVERSKAVSQVAVVWDESDSLAAVAWARSLSHEDGRDDLLLAIAHESIREGPARVIELAAELPAGCSRDELLAQAVGNWALRDPRRAADWAQALPTEAGRARALEAVAVNWATIDAVAAAGFALENLASGKALDRAVVAMVQRWAQRDPNSAAKWIEGFAPGDLQSAVADNLMANWFAGDPQGPAGWLESLHPGALRDNAIAGYARQLASVDQTAQATTWLSLIGNKDLRRGAVETVAAFHLPPSRN